MSSRGGFETWVLIMNLADTDAKASLTYMTEKGEVTGPTVSLAAHTRKTVNVADSVPDTWSVSRRASSDKPVIAERAVYWRGRTDGTDSIGVPGQ